MPIQARPCAETGQSIGSPPASSTLAPSRRTSASSVVLISAHIWPGLSAAKMPSSASSTKALIAGLGRHVIIRSTCSVIAAGDSPHVAPASSRCWAADRSRSRTVRSVPLRNKLPASFAPTLPRPINPTRMVLPRRLLEHRKSSRPQGTESRIVPNAPAPAARAARANRADSDDGHQGRGRLRKKADYFG